MTYKEYQNMRQEGFNALPVFFAFSNKQLEEGLSERGLTMDDIGQLIRLGDTGGFFLRKDKPLIDAWFNKDYNKEIKDLIESSDDFAHEAFSYEMANHEYPINWEGDYDVCSIFGNCEFSEEKDGADYLRDMGYSENIVSIYREEARAICREFDY